MKVMDAFGWMQTKGKLLCNAKLLWSGHSIIATNRLISNKNHGRVWTDANQRKHALEWLQSLWFLQAWSCKAMGCLSGRLSLWAHGQSQPKMKSIHHIVASAAWSFHESNGHIQMDANQRKAALQWSQSLWFLQSHGIFDWWTAIPGVDRASQKPNSVNCSATTALWICNNHHRHVGMDASQRKAAFEQLKSLWPLQSHGVFGQQVAILSRDRAGQKQNLPNALPQPTGGCPMKLIEAFRWMKTKGKQLWSNCNPLGSCKDAGFLSVRLSF